MRRKPFLLAATLGAAIILVLAGSGLALAFTDTVGSPYATAIDELAARHIINGFPGDVFKPNDPVIRQQFAKMIVLTLGYEVPATATCLFTDVDATPNPNDPLYPAKYVAVCAAEGITVGTTPSTFAPYANITRQQLITMVARSADLPDAPAGFDPGFTVGQFGTEEHFANARKAASAGLLAGLQGVGPGLNFGAAASRGECAQLLWNLLSLADPALPMFADLKTAGPVGFTFTINTPIIWSAEHEDDGVWDKILPASTITGHVSVQTLAVGSGQVTIKLTIDELTLPEDTEDAQDTMAEILPAYLLLRLDDQGTVLGISYAIKDKPEQVLDQTMVAGLATFLTPFTSALMLPYSGQLAKPGDHLDIQKTYTSLGKKIMDVETQGDYLSFASGVADLGFDLAVTNIDIPLRFDMKPFLPLLGHDVPTGNEPWILDLSVGTTILANGEYNLDTASGLPTGMTLSSTMMLDAWIHQVPSKQLLTIWPNSDFAHGWVDHAYLRAADRKSPITVTFSMTKDAAQ